MDIKKIIQEEVRSFFKKNEGFLKESVSKEEFLKNFNIDPDELTHMGAGDFGDAYSTGDGRILKITSSKSEFDLAKKLVGNKAPALDGFVDYYYAGIVDGDHYILMEEIDEDSSIEDIYYQVESYLSNEGLPIQYIHMLDVDELELDEYVLEFISDLEDINQAYRYIGVEASDIKPDNMGYDKNGKLKAFDIDDRSINEGRYSAFIDKARYPKIPVANIFKNPYTPLGREERSGADSYIDQDKFETLPVQKVNINKIVPTQKVVTVGNLDRAYEDMKDETGAYLLKIQDKYYILDGHHRIANKIASGEDKVKAHVYEGNGINEESTIEETARRIESLPDTAALFVTANNAF